MRKEVLYVNKSDLSVVSLKACLFKETFIVFEDFICPLQSNTIAERTDIK